MSRAVQAFMDKLIATHPAQPEFHEAVHEVVQSVMPYYEQHAAYREARILERMVEPDRIIIFRINWRDDKGEVQVNRGYRVQMNGGIGPYKGGLRFHPTVNLSIMKFLAFEQVFKNALTTLPMGGGKGGSDFDPKGKSDVEVMRFCQGFMSELFRHIGPNTDIPAGDIGVGGREIGYLYGMYRKLSNEFTGVLTGKGVKWGGSLIRPEATGYGLVFFVEEMLKTRKTDIKGKTVIISGAGNAAQYAAEKCIQLGAKVVSMSDSNGTIHDPDGITSEKLAWLMELKNVKRGRIKEYTGKFKSTYHEGKRPWNIPCEIALPCATQDEISGTDAKALVKNGCIAVGEGANMPSTPDAIKVFIEAKILFAPGKAANAGGVATSGLEMAQNSMRLNWTREEVENRLRGIMRNIHEQCVEHGTHGAYVNYVTGANLAGFIKVADAMIEQGLI